MRSFLCFIIIIYIACMYVPSGESLNIDINGRGGINAEIGILGAGITGISSAMTFEENGIKNWMILESNYEAGGRMKNGRLGNLNIEHGANWIQGTRGNPIYDWAKKCDIKMVRQDWENKLIFYNGTFTEKMNTKRMDSAQICAERLGKKIKKDTDLATALNICGWSKLTPIDDLIEWYYTNYETASDPDATSLGATIPLSTYDDFKEEDLLIYDQRGMKQIAKCIIEKNNLANKIIYNTKVISLSNTRSSSGGEDNLIEVKTNTTTYYFKYVIITFSLGVLQNKFDILFDDISWPMNQKMILFSYHMKTYMKLFLQFPSKFWQNNDIFLVPSTGVFDPTLIQSLDPHPMPNSKVLFATATDALAERLEFLPDENITHIIMSLLKYMYGNVPSPINVVYPRWFTNEYFYGSYSNVPPGFTPQNYDDLEEPLGTNRNIFISGEALCKRMSGYMQSGYEMGIKTAKKIANENYGFKFNVLDNFCDTPL